MLRIGIVDDHHLFRESLSLLINSFSGFSVVLEAENGESVIEKLNLIHVDVLLLDIQMPVMNGFETCKILHDQFPDVKILIVSELTTQECIHKIMECGAHGFFSKTGSPENLKSAINGLYKNGYYFGAEIGSALLTKLWWNIEHPKEAKFKSVNFTPQELTIIKMACKELSSGEIAAKLNINIRTVDTHREKIMMKTGAKNFIGAILFAVKHYHISLD